MGFSTHEELNDYISEYYGDCQIMIADDLHEAFIGVCYDMAVGQHRAIYQASKIIEILQNRDGMTEEEAEEFFTFNISGAYVGQSTPIWLEDLTPSV